MKLKHPAILHTLLLISLLLLLAYVWLMPIENFKPGGLEVHLMLMIFGGAISYYLLRINKHQWALSKSSISVMNIILAILFIGFHVFILSFLTFKLVIE